MSIETTLFAAADKMWGNMDPGEYKHVALGLIFLRYVSESFQRLHDTLSEDQYSDAEDRDEYLAENIFWVPEKARWSFLAKNSKSPEIGVMLDDAMRAIEADNESLKGALPKVYGKESMDRGMLSGLMDLFTNFKLAGNDEDFDLIGRVYEYFIGEFASAEGKRGGEFYTPKPVVDTLIEMIEPTKGRVYDPCCGTGGFFVQSEKFIDAHKGQKNDIAIYGQERNHTTYGLARMNLAIRGIFAEIRWNSEGTLLKDAFPDERFDYVLANPPFNISDWSGDLLREDARWKFGAPPVGNANYAWLQHIHTHLSSKGIGGVVLANGSMSSMSGGEGDIRRAMVEGDAVDAMVALPGQLFYGTQIPACLWILAKDKSNGIAKDAKLRDRRGEVLFIDARKMGALVPGSRKQKELSRVEIEKIATAYHAWRGEPDAGAYEDVAGFCKSATTEEIAKHNFVLTPGRYVGAGEVEDDGEPFEEKFTRLMRALRQQFAEGRRLEAQIEDRLGELK
ncbi:type I restriction-modification system subunit M [Aliiroseovarius lamellibrachiae]|uniref:type I restriction-modification system subunit M n=1 Tax=Aliiroseovarius lamellibrachiae TaxID=1924933 RepID=UPI001BDF8CB5|nr:class I SAM-dependent DNA methyltransferase [Aliiroseovarius lamellibrachiae]MBT2131006.1 type I restriction-modification system subunit M [Aliiroseovarius lamellibrachiae]